jgi:tetratricopeptide (TPR) repeat protein
VLHRRQAELVLPPLLLCVLALGLGAAELHAWWLRTHASIETQTRWLRWSAWHRARLGQWLIDEYRRGRCHPEMLGLWPAEVRLSAVLVNWLVNIDVASGCYARAQTWRARASSLPPTLDEVVRLNEAEALANQGQVEASLAHVEHLPCLMPMMHSARAGHRAWSLAQQSDAAGARAALVEGREEDLPEDYRAEWSFSTFVVCLAEGALPAAAQALKTARARARRETTRRNLLFLEARLAEREGDDARAAGLYAQGAAHPYRFQGGEALLAWGDCLTRLGRRDEARAAWELCRARDPESWAAPVAAARLWR